ncbi:MAG: ATP synthase F1 subunit gamma [Nitrospirota bacterium]|nr:ATP synthase F1 subunit gamma [Nitrospirota bacterium]
MASLQHIRRRIASVKNTQKVTKAMKMVSASKLRRAQESAEAARPYARKMNEMFGGLGLDPAQTDHPLLKVRTPRRVGVLVVTPDRGLCGALNTNVCRMAYAQVQDLAGKGMDVAVVAVGRKAREFFSRRGVEIEHAWTGLLGGVTYASASEVGSHLVERFMAERFDQVFLVFAHFKSVISQVAECHQLLPIPVEVQGGPERSFLYEPSEEDVLGALLPKYVVVQLFQALLESSASEQGARMTAMDSASRNAGEVIKKLTLLYNKTRQEAVTKELLDIIGGVEALKGG